MTGISRGDFTFLRGVPLPYGASHTARGINFSIFSKSATATSLVLFKSGISEPVAEIGLDPLVNRTGQVWHIEVVGAGEDIRYGWRMDGPDSPKEDGYRFSSDIILIDPYARVITGGAV